MNLDARLAAANDHRALPGSAVDLRTVLTRHHAEAWIERLISLLDALDGESDDEPWLAGYDSNGDLEDDAGDDREIDCDREEGDGDADAEPSLGSITTSPFRSVWSGVDRDTSQCGWARSSTDDREMDVGDQNEAVDEDGGCGGDRRPTLA